MQCAVRGGRSPIGVVGGVGTSGRLKGPWWGLRSPDCERHDGRDQQAAKGVRKEKASDIVGYDVADQDRRDERHDVPSLAEEDVADLRAGGGSGARLGRRPRGEPMGGRRGRWERLDVATAARVGEEVRKPRLGQVPPRTVDVEDLIARQAEHTAAIKVAQQPPDDAADHLKSSRGGGGGEAGPGRLR